MNCTSTKPASNSEPMASAESSAGAAMLEGMSMLREACIMPFKEATFWYGTLLFGTGLYFWTMGCDRMTAGVILTLVGLAMSAYAVVSHHSPTLPKLKLWVVPLVITWLALGYDIYDRHATTSSRAGLVLVSAGGAAALAVLAFIAYRARQRQPSKLVIHSADYRAIENGGQVYEVSDFLRAIISGDSLVFDIENHNFVIGDQNFVPKDPLPFKPKRLQVTYSYGGQPASPIVRYEHSRLVLPEDTEIRRLKSDIEQIKQEHETAKANDKQESGDELEVRLLSVTQGVCIDVQGTTLFLRLALFSEVDMGLRKLKIRLKVNKRRYDLEPLTDLGQWKHEKPAASLQPYQKIVQTNLGLADLWTTLRSHGISANREKTGYVAVYIPMMPIIPKLIENIRSLCVEFTTTKGLYPFTFTTFSQDEATIRPEN